MNHRTPEQIMDAMHATITGYMREQEADRALIAELTKALVGILPCALTIDAMTGGTWAGQIDNARAALSAAEQHNKGE